MSYYLDFNTITIDKYKTKLKNNYLIPSQMILRENIDFIFNKFKKMDIKNIQDLYEQISSKKKAEEFAQKNNFPIKHILVLKREIASRHPPARNLIDYPAIGSIFDQIGVKTSAELYPLVITSINREKLSEKLCVPIEEVTYYAKLADVTRLRYVSAIFATLLVDTEFDTVEKIKTAAPEELHTQVIQSNEEHNYLY